MARRADGDHLGPGGDPARDGRERQELRHAAAAATRAQADPPRWAADGRGRAVETGAQIAGADLFAAQHGAAGPCDARPLAALCRRPQDTCRRGGRHGRADDAPHLRHPSGDTVFGRHRGRSAGICERGGIVAQDHGSGRSDGCARRAELRAAADAGDGAALTRLFPQADRGDDRAAAGADGQIAGGRAARSADAAARGGGAEPQRGRGQHHHLHRRRA